MQNSFARVKEVFEQCAMYDAVVRANYMAHAELASTLADWAQRQPEPLTIIDLGCGDAWLSTHAFRESNIAQYRGVDVSEAAIERARTHTAIWPGRADVVAGNLAEFIRGVKDNSTSVVLASYSLHHFSSAAKTALIADCHRVLTTGGTLIWIDPVCDENESRDEYIGRLTHVMAEEWTALTEDQRGKACAHVRESDFPETKSWMLEQVQAVGLTRSFTFLENGFFQGWAFVKP